jgi:exopolyphosphatase / guanosine-5'-triphosphate,3'-diphosphate pyrophosphatase
MSLPQPARPSSADESGRGSDGFVRPPNPKRYAVLDLGSTTFQLLVADGEPDGTVTPVLRDREILNLGQVLGEEGRIPEDVAARAADTAGRLRDVAIRAGAGKVLAIATSALRDSPNRQELTDLLTEAVGGPVRFIDGHEEARLTFAGVAASVALGSGPTLQLDLGGGSLEVALADERGLRWGESVPVGAGRLTGLLVEGDPPTRAERKLVRSTVESALEPLRARVKEARPKRFVASGGTVGALGRLIAAERWELPPETLNQFHIPVEDLQAVTRKLAGLTLKERLKLRGIDERRAEILPAGGWILTTAAGIFGAESLIHSEWGLREGVVLDALGLARVPPPLPEELRARSVQRLVRVWGEDPAHVDIVARVAGRLFEETAELHGLGGLEREWLEHGARLHEIGTAISPAKFHKHGAYLVEHSGIRGFSPEEVASIATIVRFQRGKDPRAVYPPFAALDERARYACVVLVALLRVAHPIARGLEGEALDVSVEVADGILRIGISGAVDPHSAVLEARQNVELLERALGRSVEVDRSPT